MRKAKKWMTLFLALLLLIQPAAVQAEDESIEDVLNKPSEYTYVDFVLQTWKKGDFPHAFNTAQDIIAVLAELSSRAPKTVDSYLNAVFEANDIPTQVDIRLPNGKTSSKRLNMELFMKRLILVYGTPQDVSQVIPNDKKIDENGQEQYRFLGFDASGNPYINLDFPDDAQGTNNVGQRKWLERPWARPSSEIHNNVKPEETNYMKQYDRDTKAEWLDRILDKYTGDGKSRGNWDPHWTGDKLVDYAMIQQPPTQLAPGQVTLWHRRYDGTRCTVGPDYTQGGKKVCFKDWYDSFYLAPYDEWLVGLFAQFWDDLSVRARWYDPPSGVTWPNEGKEQPPGTPLVLQAQVRVDMPRLYDPTLQQIAELFMEDNMQFFYFPVNEGEIDAGTGLAKVNAWVIFATPQGNDIEIIGAKKVELVHGQTKLVNMEWKFPEKDTEVYVIVIPELEGKNANFLEFNLANNLMSMVVRVDEGGSPPNQFDGNGLDNIKINAFIPRPGNGGKKPGERIDYRTVVQAELPTDYIRISFNGGSQSNPIPMYPEVVSRLNEISSWDYVYVSRSGTSVNVSANPQISYIGTCTNSEGEPYPCTKWRTNPNYSRAQSAVSQLASQWNSIQATVTVQGKTCTVTLVRGGPEQSCVIEGTMPNTESFVYSKVEGVGIREWTYADNEARIMMYPILTKETDATNSTGTVEYYQLDPKTGAATKNTQTEPAKFGQQVRITVSSSPNLEYMETKYGYPLFRMNTEYANIRYGTGRLRYVPQGGTFEVSGNTPSATYNGISKQSTDNKTWNNDFENIAKGGSNIKYLYDVERRERSYGPWTWYEYETFWANCSDCKDLNGNTKPLVRAEVETTWRTKKDHHWIVDLVKTDDSPIGYWPQYGTLPPLKDGVPTPISQGGKPQTVKPVFTYKHNDKTRGVITKQINNAPDIHMFGTLVTSIGGGS